MAEQTESPVLDLLARMTADSMEASRIDARTLMLVRIAALVAVDAPPASYMMNLGAAGEAGIADAEVRGCRCRPGPDRGDGASPRPGATSRALGLAMELAELAEEAEGES